MLFIGCKFKGMLLFLSDLYFVVHYKITRRVKAPSPAEY